MDAVRIDKWLWAARFFKTRPLAVKACELGRVELKGQRVKPARDVRVGEALDIRTEGGDFTVEVVALSDVRGPASVAQGLYRETDESREKRAKVAAAAKAMQDFGGVPDARPSKRDRQALLRVRGRS